MRKLIFIIYLCSVTQLTKAGSVQLSEKEMNQIKQRLEAYEASKLSFDEISGTVNVTNMALLTNMTAYFRMRSNDVTTKMLLPISRCFVIVGEYSDARALAQRYLNVHSNDCRGWNILFVANDNAESYDAAVQTGTNALSFGCEENLPALGAAALRVHRTDVLENLVIPRMLAKKDSDPDSQYRQEMRTFLAYYSVISTNETLFVKALRGVKRNDVGPGSDLGRCIKEGCELFKTKEAERICRELN
ncbi:MAG TPA: hypothetical protein VFZ59_22510 [Verrucomicrobiae bacterium]|nr:hypothetical protein [Verrucomicrobiae bacterium]